VTGLSNSGGRHAVSAVSDVDALAGVEQPHTVQRYLPLTRHDPDTPEGRDQPGLRGSFHELPESTGVVAVGVGQPDPAHVLGVDRLGQG
jgi:hypothetical protein